MAKIILTQPVNGLGSAGDVLRVKDGYARNYLLPRGFAIAWTRGGQKQVESIRAARALNAAKDLDAAEQLGNALREKGLTVYARAGKEGKLFGTVTTVDVIKAIQAAGLGELDRRRIELPHQIKSLGSYPAVAHIHDRIVAEFSIDVVADTSKK